MDEQQVGVDEPSLNRIGVEEQQIGGDVEEQLSHPYLLLMSNR